MTFEVQFDLDDKSLVLHDTSAAAAEAVVEQAKQDVQDLVDGIPADYTQLSEDVDNLREDVNELQTEVNGLDALVGTGVIE